MCVYEVFFLTVRYTIKRLCPRQMMRDAQSTNQLRLRALWMRGQQHSPKSPRNVQQIRHLNRQTPQQSKSEGY